MLLVKKLVSFCYTEGRGPKTSEFCQRGHCTNTSRLCHVFVIYCGQCFLHTGEHTQSRYTIRCKNDSDLFIHPMSNIHISFPTQNKLWWQRQKHTRPIRQSQQFKVTIDNLHRYNSHTWDHCVRNYMQLVFILFSVQ